MKKCKLMILALLLLRMPILSEDTAAQIKKINSKVEMIEKNTAVFPGYEKFYIKFDAHGESTPFIFEFYFIGESLIKDSKLTLLLAKISVAHETWKSEFYYFFDYDDGKIMKFVKKTLFRADNPPKTAIIFDKSGKIIWSNYNGEIPMDPDDIKACFDSIKMNLFSLLHKLSGAM